MAVDSHCHLQDFPSKKRSEILSSKEVYPIVTGYSFSSNKKAVDVSEEYNLAKVLGIAPQTVIKEKPDLELWIEHIKKSRPNAIGEVGLDYKWATTPEQREEQKEALSQFIDLAASMNKPLVIHCRDAYDDLIDMIQEHRYDGKLMMHSYFGTYEQAEKLSSLAETLFSINTIRTKEKKKLLSFYDISHFVVETDSPYIARDPREVKEAITYIAAIKDMDFTTVEEQTAINAASFFSIKREDVLSYKFNL
ncbi:MAG: TatD family deoxyribonuclease [Methanobacteriota archaeon]|nr:MAG: TatD family deoxyribonuclease [Euryarchaeota archaeon]